MLLYFFFKKKTAYVLRISDWSSDVCSSDLAMAVGADRRVGTKRDRYAKAQRSAKHRAMRGSGDARLFGNIGWIVVGVLLDPIERHEGGDKENALFLHAFRSEEHTSELQSLMRSSYAVFCLKKKTI